MLKGAALARFSARERLHYLNEKSHSYCTEIQSHAPCLHSGTQSAVKSVLSHYSHIL